MCGGGVCAEHPTPGPVLGGCETSTSFEGGGERAFFSYFGFWCAHASP